MNEDSYTQVPMVIRWSRHPNPFLACCVFEKLPEFEKIKEQARDELKHSIEDESFIGPLGDPERIAKEVRVFYTCLRDNKKLEIRYSVERDSRENMYQEIRLAPEIFRTREGCCLDLVLFLAACILQVRIAPIIIILEGHAILGYWKCPVPNSYSSAPMLKLSELANLVEKDQIGLIETTNLPKNEKGQLSSFEVAEKTARANFKKQQGKPGFAVNVIGARNLLIESLDLDKIRRSTIPYSDNLWSSQIRVSHFVHLWLSDDRKGQDRKHAYQLGDIAELSIQFQLPDLNPTLQPESLKEVKVEFHVPQECEIVTKTDKFEMMKPEKEYQVCLVRLIKRGDIQFLPGNFRYKDLNNIEQDAITFGVESISVDPNFPWFPLIGRDDELQRLEVRLKKAKQRQGGVFVVEGEGGVGKSSLMFEAIIKAKKLGFRVFAASTFSGDLAEKPLGVFERALGAYAPQQSYRLFTDSPAAHHRYFINAPTPARTNLLSESDYFVVWQKSIQNLDCEPTLIFLDDFHEADETSKKFLARLKSLHCLDGRPILILVAQRPYETRAQGSAYDSEYLALKGLDPDATMAVFNLVRNENPVTAITVPASLNAYQHSASDWLLKESQKISIFDDTGGNPLFIIELARSGKGSKSSILRTRWYELAEAYQNVFYISVLSSFPYESALIFESAIVEKTLMKLGGQKPSTVDEALRFFSSKGDIRRAKYSPQLYRQMESKDYEFTKGLIWVTWKDLWEADHGRREVEQMHAIIAESMLEIAMSNNWDRVFQENWLLPIARHYTLSGGRDNNDAVRFYIKAIQLEERQRDHRSAVQIFEELLDHHAKLVPEFGDLRAELLLRFADHLFFIGRWEDARKRFYQVMRIQSHSAVLDAEAKWGISCIDPILGQTRAFTGHQIINDLKHIHVETLHLSWRAIFLEGRIHSDLGQLSEALACLGQALEQILCLHAAEPLNQDISVSTIDTYLNYITSCTNAGLYSLASELCREAIKIADEAGLQGEIWDLQYRYAVNWVCAGGVKEATEQCRAYISDFWKEKDPFIWSQAMTTWAVASWYSLDFTQAERKWNQVFDHLKTKGSNLHLAYSYYAFRGDSLCDIGCQLKALENFAAAEEFFTDEASVYDLIELKLRKSNALLMLNRFKAALCLTHDCLQLLGSPAMLCRTETHNDLIRTRISVAQIHFSQGDYAQAESLLTAVLSEIHNPFSELLPTLYRNLAVTERMMWKFDAARTFMDKLAALIDNQRLENWRGELGLVARDISLIEGNYEFALTPLADQLLHCQRTGNKSQAVYLLLFLGQVENYRNHPLAALAYFQKAENEALRNGDFRNLLWINAEICSTLTNLGHFARAEKKMDAIYHTHVSLLDNPPDRQAETSDDIRTCYTKLLEAETDYQHARILGNRGDYREALNRIQHGIALCQEWSFTDKLIELERLHIECLGAAMLWQLACDAADECYRQADDLDFPGFKLFAYVTKGRGCQELGRLPQARVAYKAGLELAKKLKSSADTYEFLLQLADLATLQLDLIEAEQYLKEARCLCENSRLSPNHFNYSRISAATEKIEASKQ